MVQSGALNFDDLSLSLNIIAILKWKLPLESVEKVVSKTECPKLFQPGLNYHTPGVVPKTYGTTFISDILWMDRQT